MRSAGLSCNYQLGLEQESAMKSRNLGFSLTLASLILLAVSSMASADIYYEADVVTHGMPGQPDGSRIQKSYYTAHASRTDMGDGNVMIVNYDTGAMYHLNTGTKTYSETNINQMGMPSGPPQQNEMQQKMMKDMMQNMQVTPTGEAETINGYPCKKYKVNFMMMQSDYWVSKDVKNLYELKALSAQASKAFEKNPMLKQMSAMGMMEKLDGFPVRTISHVMNGTTTVTLRKLDSTTLNKDLFTVPAGYTQQPGQ
jgi:hypothetical protein